MSTPRSRFLTAGVSAVLLAAVLVVGKIDAAVTSTYEQRFVDVTWDTRLWTARWNRSAQAVELASGAGVSWFPLDALAGKAVGDIAFSPGYATDLMGFIGAVDGIYRTRDAGGTWARVLTTANAVSGLVLSPAFSGDRIGYAITNGSGFWRTVDGGESWQQVDATANGFGIALSPAYASDRTVYVAAFDRILKSMDGGSVWEDVSAGIDPSVLVNGDIRAIAVDSGYASNRTVYVATFGKGVYRSTDAGATWATVNPAAVSVPYASKVAASTNGRMAAIFLSGVYESSDRGTTWSVAYAGSDANDLAYSKDGELLIARPGGVYRLAAQRAIAIAGGWSGGDALVLEVSPTLPDQGSVVAGQTSGARILRSGHAPSGIALSPPTGVDDSPYRVLRATVLPTATIPAGTHVTYELSVTDAQPTWEGPVIPGEPWTFTTSGSTLQWRVTLASSSGTATPQLHGLVINFELDETLPAPVATGATPTSTTIAWQYTSTGTGITGFAVERSVDGAVVAETNDPKATVITESRLRPNTEFCGRRIVALRGTERSPTSAPYVCIVTLAVPAPAPTVVEQTASSARLTLTGGRGNGEDVLYAIRDNRSQQYVAADGTLGATTPTWQRLADWTSGDVTVIGLAPSTSYDFCLLGQNYAGAVTECSEGAAVTTVGDTGARGDVTATVRAGTTQAVAVGDVIPVTVTLTHVGTGPVADVGVNVPIPTQGRYVPGSMAIGGAKLTDALDGDAGDDGVSTPGAVSFRGLTLGVGATSTLTLAFTATEPVGGFLQLAPTLAYRPGAGLAPRTVAVIPVELDVVGPAIVVEPEPVQPKPEPPPPPAEPTPAPEPTAPPVVPTAPPTEGAPTTQPTPTAPPTPPTNGAPKPPTEEGGAPAPTGVPGTVLELELSAPTPDAVISSGQLVVRGRATSGERVRIGLDDRTFWEVAADTDGSFAVTIRSLAPGAHRVSAVLGAMNRSVPFTVTPPPEETLALTSPLSGTATNAATVVASGRGPAAAAVTVALDGVDVALVTATESGGFSAALPGPLPEGVHRIEARATTRLGVPLAAATTITIDRSPPPPPNVRELRVAKQQPSTARAEAFDVALALTGTVPDDVFASLDALLITVASDPVTFAFRPEGATWSYETTLALEPGAHTARVAARDSAGNVSPLPQLLTFTVAPSACGDGIDNDGDGKTDFPSDPDCTSSFDRNEATEGIAERAAGAVADATTATAKAVATATEATAKTTAKAAEAAATTVQKQVLDNPTVEVTTERIVAPAVVVAVATNTATAVRGFQLLAYGQYLVSIILSPGRLLARRRRKAWGTIYASLSKRPVDLATIRLVDHTGRVVATEVTDHLGRYSFQVKREGTYRIEVKHADHVFPSAQLAGKAEDAAYTDLYFGDPITVPVGGAFIAKNIPVDRKDATTVTDAQAVWKRYGRIASGVVSDAGLALSIVAFAVSPRPYVGVILGVNLVFYILFRRIAKRTHVPRSWGAVSDARSKTPLHLAVVRLFDTEFNKLLETIATDRYGRYRFLVGRSMYFVMAQKAGYDPARSKTIDLTSGEGLVGVDLKLQPAAGAAKPEAATYVQESVAPAGGAPSLPRHSEEVADEESRPPGAATNEQSRDTSSLRSSA